MFTKIITAVALITGASYAMADERDASLVYYEQQVGLQRKIVVEEKAAFDRAIETRNNSVHLGQDVLDDLAYGVSTGVLTYDFLKGTNNVEAVRNLFTAKKVPAKLIPPKRTPVSDAQVALEESAASATAAKATDRALMYRKIGATAYRTTEAASAAVLGVFFVGDLYTTGTDLTIRFSDTKEIAEHRKNLAIAEKNLRVADQNLQTAALANQF
jgi:hypothetical protein